MRSGPWNRTSASQISTFELCARRWFADSVLGLREPETSDQRLGKEVHAEIEQALKTGAVPSGVHAARAADALKRLPAHGTPGLVVEGRVELAELYQGGPGLLGFVDSALRDRGDGCPHIFDVKTKNPSKSGVPFRYGLTPQELATDVQLAIYARFALEEVPIAARCGIAHVYVQRRGAVASKIVQIDVTRAHVEDIWNERVIGNARKQLAIARSGATFYDLTPNPKACDKYPPKGCPHAKMCGPFAGLTSAATPRGEVIPMATLMDKINAKMNRSAGTSAAAQAAAPATVSPAPVDPSPEAGEAAGVATFTGVLPPDAPARVVTDEEKAAVAIAQFAADAAASGGKKKAAKRKSVSVTMMVDGKEVELGVDGIPEPVQDVVSIHAECLAQVVTEAGKPQLVVTPALTDESGLLTGTSALTIAGSTVEQKIAAVREASRPLAEALDLSKVVKSVHPSPRCAPILYVNCRPVKGVEGVVEMDDWLAGPARVAAERAEVADWQLTEYGKGPGYLAEAIRDALDTLPALVHVDGASPGARVFLQIVRPLASAIYQGEGR